jgi:hypothetical protein
VTKENLIGVYMNMNRKLKQIVMSAGGVILTSTNALAAQAQSGSSYLSSTISGLDPSIQPFAQLVADNIVLIFNFVIVCGILGYGAWAAIQKRQGHTSQAADARASAWDVLKVGVAALVMVNIFIALSGKFGI